MWPGERTPNAGLYVREQVDALRAARPGLVVDVLVIMGGVDIRVSEKATGAGWNTSVGPRGCGNDWHPATTWYTPTMA